MTQQDQELPSQELPNQATKLELLKLKTDFLDHERWTVDRLAQLLKLLEIQQAQVKLLREQVALLSNALKGTCNENTGI